MKEEICVKFKKLHPDAKPPIQGTEYSAGYDLTCVAKEMDEEHNVLIYHTGLALEIPNGHVGLLFPRSSIYKFPLVMPYSVGVIDSDYRGEVLAMFKDCDFGNFEPAYSVGERCCQLIIVELPKLQWVEANILSPTTRGTNGHGSTGLN